jgi:hypothetical protein
LLSPRARAHCRLGSGAALTVGLALAAQTLSGCMVRHDYLVRDEQLSSGAPVIPAQRVKGGDAVELDAQTLTTRTPLGDGTTRVTSAKRSRMVDAGIWLTWIGSGISIVGSGLFFAGLGSRDARYDVGLVMAPSAEPLMIAGTVLWVLGLKRHPQEVGGRGR